MPLNDLYGSSPSANLVLAFAGSPEVGTSFFDQRRLAFWVIGASANASRQCLLSLSPIYAKKPNIFRIIAVIGAPWSDFSQVAWNGRFVARSRKLMERLCFSPARVDPHWN